MLDRGLDKQEWIDLIKSERARWEALLAEVGQERMNEPGVEGEWSVKDIIGHNTYWEDSATRRLEAALRGETPVPNPNNDLDIDEHNALVYTRNKEKSLDQVLAESAQVCARIVAAVEALSAEELGDRGRYPWMSGAALWEVVPGDSYDHYAEHAADIRKWLERATA